MNPKRLYTKVVSKHLNKSISECYYGILFIVLINILIGLFVVLIEDSIKNETLVPFTLFFLPATFYFFVAKRTKLNSLRYEIYFVIGIFYISICLIEFREGYSLDKLMSIYWSKEKINHPMSYVLQLIPVVYKSFRLGLSLFFFRVAYLVFKYHKLTKDIT